MRILNDQELSAVSGGEVLYTGGVGYGDNSFDGPAMCPGGIDSGESCMANYGSVNDYSTGKTLTATGIYSSADTIGMSMSSGSSSVTVSGSLDENGYPIVTVSNQDGQIIGGACIRIDN